MKKLDTEEPTFMNTNNSKDNDEISDSGNESGSDDDADEVKLNSCSHASYAETKKPLQRIY
jgi:hypothetical protein